MAFSNSSNAIVPDPIGAELARLGAGSETVVAVADAAPPAARGETGDGLAIVEAGPSLTIPPGFDEEAPPPPDVRETERALDRLRRGMERIRGARGWRRD